MAVSWFYSGFIGHSEPGTPILVSIVVPVLRPILGCIAESSAQIAASLVRLVDVPVPWTVANLAFWCRKTVSPMCADVKLQFPDRWVIRQCRGAAQPK